jgi:hypothetical protein
MDNQSYPHLFALFFIWFANTVLTNLSLPYGPPGARPEVMPIVLIIVHVWDSSLAIVPVAFWKVSRWAKFAVQCPTAAVEIVPVVASPS